MKLTFIGAAHEVTGSCYYLEACGKKILVDCGMEQGMDFYVNQNLPVPESEIDAVLLTHAHIDHSGNLPLLYKKGFRGKVYATGATYDLCEIMLRDSAHIQMTEAEWKNRKRKRSGDTFVEPAYTDEDAREVVRLFVSVSYKEIVSPFEGIKVCYNDAGHLLGSSSIEVWITEADVTKKIVFSGDIGNIHKPLLKRPQYIEEADYVVMESTYGDRKHVKNPDYVAELSKIIQTTFDRGGNVVIPSFAVGRTQELLYFIHQIKDAQLVKGYGDFKVYVDSPLANEATRIYEENMFGYFDQATLDIIRSGENPIAFKGLITSITTADSMAINMDNDPKVIISASGMCEAGRIRHHLKHNLWRKESTILFVGHQAGGTLGRMILDGVPQVKLFGELIKINAEIRTLAGISSHADMECLIFWLRKFKVKPQKVFVVHGEGNVVESFSELLRSEYGYDVYAPYSGAIYDLAADAVLKEGTAIELIKGEHGDKKAESRQRTDSVFEHLVTAGRRLSEVIQTNRDGANKDLSRFERQILDLIDQWER
ncbi:MBL fold metallo-hydrolase RNA specificity domain-containing protein [Parasporobacterium paucivorans]|uniref:Metallo-beta-lactamase family protein n=1 Tax=Parasporobacterium paucivorans DSM 15970 TaxID=1122934 RepID=A0A1M6HJQ5_9FIRM|nr:MBL fold metallo-hydrolase [Parasporobacterium paucivorans]SHJ22433.1 metallo-beta-lactamase family protein [Parasporobacterium paucivorans DSM 15970]